MRIIISTCQTLALSILLILAITSCNSTMKAELPNIAIIFTDDQGYQDPSCFGSPNINGEKNRDPGTVE